jgi:uncharacterized membrane protein YkvA (DUF1232 family)
MPVNKSVRPASGTPWGAVISLVTAILYGVSPIDLIPDIIPLLGLADDAVVVPLLLLMAFLGFRKRRKAVEASQKGSLRIPGA